MLSRVQLFATPWTGACQAPLSMGFSRQYWSGLPRPPPGDLPNPGIKPVSLMSPSLPLSHQGRPIYVIYMCSCSVAKPCLTFCDPMDCSPPGSAVHGISRGKNTGVSCHFLLQGIFLPLDQTRFSSISCMGRRVLYHWRHLGSPSFSIATSSSSGSTMMLGRSLY